MLAFKIIVVLSVIIYLYIMYYLGNLPRYTRRDVVEIPPMMATCAILILISAVALAVAP